MTETLCGSVHESPVRGQRMRRSTICHVSMRYQSKADRSGANRRILSNKLDACLRTTAQSNAVRNCRLARGAIFLPYVLTRGTRPPHPFAVMANAASLNARTVAKRRSSLQKRRQNVSTCHSDRGATHCSINARKATCLSDRPLKIHHNHLPLN